MLDGVYRDNRHCWQKTSDKDPTTIDIHNDHLPSSLSTGQRTDMLVEWTDPQDVQRLPHLDCRKGCLQADGCTVLQRRMERKDGDGRNVCAGKEIEKCEKDDV